MIAKVSTYGGELGPWGTRYVQHWVLTVDGEFLGDTSRPEIRNLYYAIAEKLND